MEKEEIMDELNMYSFASFDLLRKLSGPMKKIRPKDIFVLVYIYRNNEEHQVTITDLAATLHVSCAAISQSVNNYEKQGWVKRVRSVEDRRTVYVQITEKTEQVLKKEWELKQKTICDYLDFIGPENANHLIEIVRKSAEFVDIEINDDLKEIFHCLNSTK